MSTVLGKNIYKDIDIYIYLYVYNTVNEENSNCPAVQQEETGDPPEWLEENVWLQLGKLKGSGVDRDGFTILPFSRLGNPYPISRSSSQAARLMAYMDSFLKTILSKSVICHGGRWGGAKSCKGVVVVLNAAWNVHVYLCVSK